jgi:hypothetical protein
MALAEALPDFMTAVLTTAHGSYDVLQYRTDVRRPQPATGEVLIKVGAAGVNNTDINTRTGWYSKSVLGATDERASATMDRGVANHSNFRSFKVPTFADALLRLAKELTQPASASG